MRIVLMSAGLLALVAGCASEPEIQYVWLHPAKVGQQVEADKASCEARAYRFAGSPPRMQPIPQCDSTGKGFTGGFACGLQQGQAQKANREAQETWDKALESGYKSCMYGKGYSRENVQPAT